MSIPPSLICDSCGSENLPQALFCRACGRPFQNGQPTLYDSATGRLLKNIILKQRYQIIGPAGRGGMGAVYKAVDMQLGNRTVAVKEMGQRGLNPQEVRDAADAFKQEAIILAGLQHPNLPSIFDHFEEHGRWYLVMSFIPGETLAEYLSRSPGGKLPLDEALQIGMQLCTVLDYLHKRQPPIIFRDLKPTNVMRTPDGHIYLIDFGIARHFKPGQARDTAYYGSMGYAPPEQYGNAQTTQRSDIYSLGVTLHQMLSGHKPSSTPFLLPPLQSLLPGALDDLAVLLAQMLDMDEYKRPASMLEVKQRLQSIASTAAALQIPPPPPPPRVSLTPPPPPPPQFEQTVYASGPNPPTPIPATQFAPPLQQVGTLTPPPVDRVSRPNRKPLLIVLAVVLLLIICGGIVFAIVNNSNTTAHNNAVATQQAQTDAAQTATAAANATASAIAAQTATAAANATATANANPDPYQQGTTLALLDPLGQQSEWASQSDSTGGQCQFTSNAYQVSQSQTSFFQICPSTHSYSNFVFEVHMTITQGDCGGITVRNNSANTNLYLFDVCQDGNYYFVKYVSNSGSQATTLKSGTSSALNSGVNQSNVLAIVANGSTFQLYVNNQQIDSASDGDFSSGTIGLVADPRSNNQTAVTYQNARLWTF